MGGIMTAKHRIILSNGLTLIEAVVALALTALLMTATVGVLQSLTKRKAVFADQLRVQSWRGELGKRLREDILAGREMRIGQRTIEIAGFGGQDPATGELTQTPALVTWELIQEDNQYLMLRCGVPRGGAEELNAVPRKELLAIGVRSISVLTITGTEDDYTDGNPPKTLTASDRPNDMPGDWSTIPKCLHLTVTGLNGHILVDDIIYR